MSQNTFTYETLDPSQAVVVLVDCQVSLMALIKDHSAKEYQNSVLAHAALAGTFNLPAVVTTNEENGPNGPLFKELTPGLLDQKLFLVNRNGDPNPWNNDGFRNAINSSGKKQILLAGTPTDATVTALALSLRDQNYSVYVNADACGASSTSSAEDAKSRMRGAGAQVMSTLAIASELASGLGTAGKDSLRAFLGKYITDYEYLVQTYDAAAKQSST